MADMGHQAPRREPRFGVRLLCRGRLPRSVLDRRPIPNPDFRLADLAQMRIATVSEVPTPWLCLREDLRQAGIDPARLHRIADRSMAENLNAVSEGRIEVAQFFEPVVEEAMDSGRGHLWYAASTRSRTTYTALVTTRDRLVGDAEPLLRMVRAIQRTQQWIYNRSAPEIAATISSFFPALDCGVMAAALARYQAQSVWGRDPVLREDDFDRLRRCLVSGGFIRRPSIRSLRRQSPRPANPDRIGFAYDPDAPADRQPGIKGDSDLSAVKAIRDLSAVRNLLRDQPGSSAPDAIARLTPLGIFCGRRPDRRQNTQANCGSCGPPNSSTLRLAALRRFAAQP